MLLIAYLANFTGVFYWIAADWFVQKSLKSNRNVLNVERWMLAFRGYWNVASVCCWAGKRQRQRADTEWRCLEG